MENMQVNAPVSAKSSARKVKNTVAVKAKTAKKKVEKKVSEKVVKEKIVETPIVQPTQPKVATRRNIDRFLEATGKTEKDYFDWATEVGRRMHINKLDALVCAKLELYTVAHLANRPTEIPEGMPETEMDEHLVANSENPYELACLWQRVTVNAENWVSKETILNEWLTGISKEDFERWGDKNHLGDINKKWWNKDAAALDVKLEEINSMSLLNQPLTFEDAIDFIKCHKPGSYVNPAQLLIKRIEERFKAVTTFRIKDYYVSHLMKMCHLVPASEELADLPF
ncbi:hypothetical protein [Arundinibacter roseus]|uniref:hypothetical protein n=1 Tax=Arundinibacter roseus TaxID=2070510 RepID=UPI001E4880A3|nr:hypothetical protein [Arundinibacter roseus]